MTPLCFLDTETDGIHPGRRVWEVGIIRRDDAGERERHFFVALDMRFSDPLGLSVGGFWDRHPIGRKVSGKQQVPCEPVLSKHEAAKEVMQWTFGAHLVGAVPSFDAEVLSGLLRSEGYLPQWHYHLVDVEALAVGWLCGRADGLSQRVAPSTLTVQPPWESDALSAACGVEPASEEERHTAMGDARWAKRIYDKVTRGAYS